MAKPKKTAKYTKMMMVRLMPNTYLQILNRSERERMEPSALVRKIIMDYFNHKKEEKH